MGKILEVLNTDMFLIVMTCMMFILLVGFVILIIKFSKLNKKYKKFIKKLGNGKNIEEDLENYMYRVERIEKKNGEILDYVKTIDEDMKTCIQKVGIVRYNAFKDTGSDLSFALALLDENNDGVVLNGIYSREMSNIYAKPIKKGKSNYTISEEEEQAIQKALSSYNTIMI
ncbi:MAG: DUF4446 family protein [Clostridia bacterium]|nr:DUF4446 family protein [Clostridia bacterium]